MGCAASAPAGTQSAEEPPRTPTTLKRAVSVPVIIGDGVPAVSSAR
jgi:hypothetical protein